MRKTITVKHTGTGGDVRVRADSERPARDAANILARRMYTWEALIGREPTASERRKYGPGVTGHNVWIYV